MGLKCFHYSVSVHIPFGIYLYTKYVRVYLYYSVCFHVNSKSC